MTVVVIAFWIGIVLLVCFGIVLFFGAPYVPTLSPQITAALDLLDLKPGQTLIELGCGDGRVLLAAARRGLDAVGYELNPILALIALLVTWRYRKQVRVIWDDYWWAGWPQAEGIFAFILPRFMPKLHKKVIQYPYRPLRVASFAFTIPGKKWARANKGVFLYEYRKR